MKKILPALPHQRAVVILIIVYTMGVIGLNSPWRDGFLVLTPLNLVLTFFTLMYFHRDWNLPFLMWSVFVFAGGYLIELYGVQTGHFFGIYHYKASLGPKVFGVPPVIGLNWLILSYSIGHLVYNTQLHPLLRIVTASLIMVLLDLFIEPVAMDLHFWDWEGGVVPLKNYLGWFSVSVVIFAAYGQIKFRRENPLAGWVVGIQFAFFIAMNLTRILL
jgi:uncharacterized membrane protein